MQMNEREFLLNLLRASLLGDTDFAVPETLDWDALIEEANRQGVSVVASDGLQKLYDGGAYSDLGDKELRRKKARWFGKTMEYEHRYAGQLAAATKMGKWLASAGIQTVILKGVTVSECYPIPSHRYSADFDCFLVKDGEHLEAYELGNQVMEKHEIAVDREFYKNSTFKVGGLMVENHKFCVPFRGNELLRCFERLLQQMILEGPLTVFGDTGLFEPPLLASALFLTEHAYSHFLHEGLNLRHILDWALFRRRHSTEVDWTAFDKYVDEFGFRRFYVAYEHLGEFVLGERGEASLTDLERRMMDSVWAGLDLHESVKGFVGKLRLVGNTLRAGWKYRAVSNISMVKGLWIQVKGFLFYRRPEL
jgi:hypothetical protein